MSESKTPRVVPIIEQTSELASDLVHRGRSLYTKGGEQSIPEPTGAVTSPIYLTSTFKYFKDGNYDYTRSGNPNFESLAAVLKVVEGSDYCTVFSSGVAAITALAQTLAKDDSVLFEENVYGCTYRLFEQVYRKFGVNSEYTDLSDPNNYSKIESLKPKYVWIESPTNPLLKIVDIAAIAKTCKSVGAKLIVDNTFATGVLQQPPALGADVSIVSTTKYIMGHSVCLGGAVCTNSVDFNEAMIFQQKACGLQPSPFDAWITQLGAQTLELRMSKHCSNAAEIASFFEKQTTAKMVRYPFLKSHPQYELAKRQMKGGSGLIAVDLGLSLEETKKFLTSLKYFAMAESLGGVESLICHPASMTHASVPKEVREKVGITDSLIRLSVGIESVDDLIKDLIKALPKSAKKAQVVSAVSNA